MTKWAGAAAIVLLFATVATGATPEAYCRFEKDGRTFYGRVDGQVVRVLDRAPWDGGVETGEAVRLDEIRLLSPSQPRVILGLSRSYREAWKGEQPFKTVRWFLKPPGSAAAPGDTVFLPASLDEVLVEVELVIVIGKRVKDADEAEAARAIFGYTVGDDIVGSVDSYHRLNGEPLDQRETLLGPGLKIGDRFAPFGPFVWRGGDWKGLVRRLTVENAAAGKKLTYEHSTATLVYTPAKIVRDLSRVLTLSPGDVIFTGTTKALPAREGDVVTVEIDGLGRFSNPIVKPH